MSYYIFLKNFKIIVTKCNIKVRWSFECNKMQQLGAILIELQNVKTHISYVHFVFCENKKKKSNV